VCREGPARTHTWHSTRRSAVRDTSPRAAAPSSRRLDHKPCFVFQTPLTTATVAQKITQVRCRRSEKQDPSLGSAPRPAAHHPGGSGDRCRAQE